LIDEDFPRDVAYALARDPRALRVIVTVDEAGWPGAPDVHQVARVVQMGGVLISHNRTDRARFRRYIEAQRRSPRSLPADPAASCVLLLPHDPSEGRLLMRTAMLLDWYVSLPLPKPATLGWNDAQQAMIGGWQAAGYSANDVRVALGQVPPP
jgi:hypothetical protein